MLLFHLTDGCLIVAIEHGWAGDGLARAIVEIYGLLALGCLPANGQLYGLALRIWQYLVEVEGYQGIAQSPFWIAVGIVTKLYLVWILWINARYQIDVMYLLATPKGTETEGKITIFGYGYPVAYDIYHVVAILLGILFGAANARYGLLGENAVYPVDINYLIVLVVLLIGSGIVDQRSYLLVAEWLLDVLGVEGGIVVELQIGGIAILLYRYQGIREHLAPVGVVIIIA